MKSILFLFLFSSFAVFAQNSFKSSYQINWKNDSSIELSLQSTNFQNERLINLIIVNNSPGYQQLQFTKDSVLIGKGISIFKKEFTLQESNVNPYQDTLRFTIRIWDVKNSFIIDSNQVSVLPRKTNWSTVSVSDSTIGISFKSSKVSYSITSSEKNDSLNKNDLFLLKSDTVINWYSLVKTDPLKKRKFQITQSNQFDKPMISNIWYDEGVFYEKQPNRSLLAGIIPQEKKIVEIAGAINFESNFFSTRPQHSNGSQYPFSSIQANSNISVYGIPFVLTGSHNTNDNISPNFRNFFSLQFDSDGFRKNMEEKLTEEFNLVQLTPAELKNQLNDNELAIDKLKKYETMAKKFNLDDTKVDSLLAKEFNQVRTSIALDSMLKLDTLTERVKVPTDSIQNDSNLIKVDSINTEFNQNLTKIQSAIQQLEKSNELKKKHLGNLKNQKTILPLQQFNGNELFSKFQSSILTSILLRFNKLNIGNFYEYTGEYSIRDVELEGVNFSFLINKSNSLAVLYGKLNDFQSFNLDEITDLKKIASIGWYNSTYSFIKPTLRVTRITDETVNPEISNTANEYYITSLNVEGDVSSWANYLLEYNTSSTILNPFSSTDNVKEKSSAYFLKSYFTPLPFLDLKLQFDRVGSNYRSDGVYFLNRNFQAYTIGGKIRLFKNKIHLKNDFAIQERNFEQKELTNRTQKQFYDFGTHFKRLPNLQVSYSPISIEVANRLDTSFSGINANTNVLIARLFYFKKVKKTLISTALVYNQIENELADDFSTQKGIQHFASISNEKTNFSFTSAYDEDFSAVRFISTSVAQKIGKKLQFNTHLAKNFRNDFYSEIIRTNISVQINSKFNIGAGGIFLIENASNNVTSGGSVSLKINY